MPKLKSLLTDEILLEIQIAYQWSIKEADMFREFYNNNLGAFSAADTWDDIAASVSFFYDYKEAFWFIEEKTDRIELLDYVVNYPTSNIRPSEENLMHHFVELHEHYYAVSNGGYVFYSED